VPGTYFVLIGVQFVYDLIEINKPLWGGLVFPERVVRNAVQAALAKSRLELCIFEAEEDDIRGEMTTRLSGAGQLLEVVGHIDELWIEKDVLKCSGQMQDLPGRTPLTQFTAIPYLDMRCEFVNDPKTSKQIRLMKEFRITEVVLIDQAVTRLAVRKFSENKLKLLVDMKRAGR
jgi:hypothetical protein